MDYLYKLVNNIKISLISKDEIINTSSIKK